MVTLKFNSKLQHIGRMLRNPIASSRADRIPACILCQNTILVAIIGDCRAILLACVNATYRVSEYSRMLWIKTPNHVQGKGERG